jgi:hypothetical protein
MSTLPAFLYRNPAEVIEQAELDSLGCRICHKADELFGRLHCLDVRNTKQTGVPTIGHRCKWFLEMGGKQ